MIVGSIFESSPRCSLSMFFSCVSEIVPKVLRFDFEILSNNIGDYWASRHPALDIRTVCRSCLLPLFEFGSEAKLASSGIFFVWQQTATK